MLRLCLSLAGECCGTLVAGGLNGLRECRLCRSLFATGEANVFEKNRDCFYLGYLECTIRLCAPWEFSQTALTF